eukprot:scaffold172907_cov30-Tisochrysis_lutea.AAC.2
MARMCVQENAEKSSLPLRQRVRTLAGMCGGSLRSGERTIGPSGVSLDESEHRGMSFSSAREGEHMHHDTGMPAKQGKKSAQPHRERIARIAVWLQRASTCHWWVVILVMAWGRAGQRTFRLQCECCHPMRHTA